MAFFVSQAFLLLRTGVFFQSVVFIVVVTIVGALILILFFGCLAACCDHRAMIWLYTILMAVFLGLSIYVFLQYSMKFHDHSELENKVSALYTQYQNSTTGDGKIVDDMQNYLMCCGNPEFGENLPGGGGDAEDPIVPNSCCVKTNLVKRKSRSTVTVVTNKNKELMSIRQDESGNSLPTISGPFGKTEICKRSNAKKTHDIGCQAKLKKLEPYLYYSNIALMALAGLAVLSGFAAGCDCWARRQRYVSGRYSSSRR